MTLKLGKISRFILFGGGNLLAHTTKFLKEGGYDVRVCSSPRHLDETPTSFTKPLKEILESLKVPTLEARDVNECPAVLEWVNGESLGIGLGPAWIFGPRICDAFGSRFVNFMGIRMPHYMGGAHYTWQILRGNRQGAVNFQRIDKTVNTGPILFNREYLFLGCETPIDFFRVAEIEELAAMREFLKNVEEGVEFPLRPLDRNFEMYYPSLNTEKQGWIDWSWGGKEIASFINAFGKPYLGASTTFQGRRVFLHTVHLENEEGGFHPFQSGMIYRVNEVGLFIAVKGGSLIVREVHGSDSKPLSLNDFRKGARFFTSSLQLETARQFDAKYTGEGLCLF